ncbi:MAG: hypothetical protein AAGD35_22850, partial [Actinomycetota bacterium]
VVTNPVDTVKATYDCATGLRGCVEETARQWWETCQDRGTVRGGTGTVVGAGFGAATLGSGTAVKAVDVLSDLAQRRRLTPKPPPNPAPNTGAIVDAGKYDYLFGNVSSNSHNLSRSLQNQRQLNRIGVYDNAAGRDLLSSHFDEVLATDSNIVRTWADEWGTHQIRESIFAGPNGVLKFESSWQVTSDGFRLETVIPFGGG